MPHLTEVPEIKRVYLIGICGTAMASLAGMLQQRGYEVAGSDEHVYPPMSTYLERLRIPVLEGYTNEHLETFRPELVVIVEGMPAGVAVDGDGSFVREAGSRPENVAIIQSIVQLAGKFRMSVTAEGVETPEQLDKLMGLSSIGLCTGRGAAAGTAGRRVAVRSDPRDADHHASARRSAAARPSAPDAAAAVLPAAAHA